MKRTRLLLLLGLFLLFCCAAAAETASPPIPTQPPRMQDMPDNLILYYNPDGGQKYHLDPRCPSVSKTYLPLAGQFLSADLTSGPYAALNPCAFCGAPLRPQTVPDEAAPSNPTPAPVRDNRQSVTVDALETPVDMPAGPDYLTLDFGVTTWRGDSFRTNAASGTLDSAPTGLEVAWKVKTDLPSIDDFRDVGFDWYSQPVIVQWPIEVRQSMGLTADAISTKALREVIFASIDGNIYFLNLADGTATREALRIGKPMLGAVTLHPMSYPLLLAGEYAEAAAPASASVGLHWINLQTQELLLTFDGKQGEDLLGAFNTSALIDRTTNTAVALSKDGCLYMEAPDLKLLATSSRHLWMQADFGKPVWVKLTDEGEQVTSAPVMYGSRLWFGTSQGRILCIDTATMQLVWSCQLDGGLIHALAMEEDADGHLWLYTGEARSNFTASAPIRLCRISADTGRIDWSVRVRDSIGAFYTGAVAACAVGENEMTDMVYFALSGLQTDTRKVLGMIAAFDKRSGEVVWQQELGGECKSAPVAVYTEDGRGWIVQTAANGDMRLFNGLTGEQIASLQLEGNRWSSPAVLDNMLVIGSCVYTNSLPFEGCIYGVRLTGDTLPAQPASPEPTAAPSALFRLTDFLGAWSVNDRDAMLALCSPDWKAQQPNPELALFQLVMNRTPLAWDITELPIEDNMRVYSAVVLLDHSNGREPAEYRFTLRLCLTSDGYFIDPTSLAACVPVAE